MPNVGGGGTHRELTIPEIAELWIEAGGSRSHVIDAVSVALAESGGRPDAVSPSHDYGVWQINRIHFGNGIINSANWDDPLVNARAAVKISGAGANWAAWCTAWVHPEGNCGHGHLTHPQHGSPAAQQTVVVEVVLGGVSLAHTTVATSTQTGGVQHSWDYFQKWLGIWGPNSHNHIQSYTALIRTAKATGRIRL